MANSDTVNAFFAVFVGGGSSAQKTASLLNLFCPDGQDALGNQIPVVGITDHDPSFFGRQDISTLFTQLFASFPNLSITPATLAGRVTPANFPPFLYSDNNYTQPTIGVQATVTTGPYVSRWFPHGGPHYSPPLSDITPNPARPRQTTLPAVIIFTFDQNNLIIQLAMYLDRHRFVNGLQAGAHAMLLGYDRGVMQQLEWVLGSEKLKGA